MCLAVISNSAQAGYTCAKQPIVSGYSPKRRVKLQKHTCLQQVCDGRLNNYGLQGRKNRRLQCALFYRQLQWCLVLLKLCCSSHPCAVIHVQQGCIEFRLGLGLEQGYWVKLYLPKHSTDKANHSKTADKDLPPSGESWLKRIYLSSTLVIVHLQQQQLSEKCFVGNTGSSYISLLGCLGMQTVGQVLRSAGIAWNAFNIFNIYRRYKCVQVEACLHC